MTHSCNAEINLDQLTGIASFIVIVAADEQLTITWASEPVLRRAENALGLKVSDIVEPIEPREEIFPSSIARNMGMQYQILLKSGGCSTPLMGQWVPSRGGFILLAGPDVRKPEDMDKFSFNDFPENDPTIELLTTREEYITSLKEAKSAANALRNKTKIVKESSQRLEVVNADLEKEITERKKAEEALRESEERINHMNHLKEELLAPLSVGEKLKKITDVLVEIFDADFARIWIIKPGDLCDSRCVHAEVRDGPHVCQHRDRCLHLMASSGRYTHIDGEVHRRVPFGCYKIGLVASGADAKFLTNDVAHNPRVHDRDWAKRLGLVSFAGYRLISKDGEPVGVLALFSKHVISSNDDTMLETLASTASQVIRTAAVEEALRQSEIKFRTIFENSGGAIFIANAKTGRIVECNSQAEKLVGRPRTEIIEMHQSEIHPQADRDKYKKLFSGSIQNKKVNNIEAEIEHKDGRIIPIIINAQTFRIGEQDLIAGLFVDITKRKQAEDALRESEEQLSLIHNATSDIMILVRVGLDGKFNFVSANKAFANLLVKAGIEQDILRDITLKKLFREVVRLDPEDVAYRLDRVRETADTKKPVMFERVTALPNMVEIVTETTLNPIVNEQSECTLILAVIKNITDRKQAEDALRASEDKYRTLVSHTPAVLWTSDQNGQTSFISSNVEQVYGYTPEEILKAGDSLWFGRIHSEDRASVKAAYAALIKREEPFDIEYRIQRRDGDWIWLHDRASRSYEVDGTLRVDGVFSDITARKKAEEELKNSEERLRILFEYAPDGYYLSDLKGNFIDGNKAAEEIIGYKRDELIGKSFIKLNLLPKAQIPKAAAGLAKNALGKPTGPDEFTLKRKDGSQVPVETRTFPVKIKGKVLILGIARDITERKQAGQALHDMNKDLESTVARLEEANRELADFAHIAAHDLKAPLRAIGTLAGMIAEDCGDKLGEQSRKQFDMLVGRTNRMSELIDGILRYSELGRIINEKEHVNLNEILQEVIATVAPPENIEITIEDKLPVIVCEKERIYEVFQNLLSNAMKYMDKPQSRIKVGCVQENAFWKFSVADNGPGIEEKYFDRIFKIFQTLSPRDEVESTGVGLALVKKIVEMYGGNIWLQSQPGQGTTFFFTLPKQE
jgi:PAS domain S-box-containing protein